MPREILNEPNGALNGERWNALMQETLSAIRKAGLQPRLAAPL